MGKATAFIEIISKVASKGAKAADDVARGAARSGADMARATGRAAATAGRLARTGLTAGAGALTALGLNRPRDDDQASVGQKGTTESQSAQEASSIVVADPLIPIPQLFIPFAEVEQELLPAAPPRARINVETASQIPAYGLIDPVTVVENYFDDKTAPITVESVIPSGVTFDVFSSTIGEMQTTIAILLSRIAGLDQRIGNLNDLVNQAIDQNNATRRSNERRRDEEQVEGPSTGDRISSAIGAASAIVGAYASKFIVPIMGFAAAGLLSGASEAMEEAGDEETIGEKLGFLEDIEEQYVKLAAGFAGMTKAGLTPQIADKVRETRAAAASVAQSARTATASRIRQATPAVVQRAGASLTQTATTVRNAAAGVAERVKANPAAQRIGSGIQRLTGYLRAAGTGANKILEPARALLRPFFNIASGVFKGLVQKPIKWYLIIEAIMLLGPAADAFALGTMSQEEFGSKVKDTLNRVIDMIGGTYIGVLIGSLGGAALGTLALPLVGTVGGGIIGAIAGFLLGEAIFRILPIDVIVNATYDYFFLDKKNAYDSLAKKMGDHVMRELHAIIDNAKTAVTDTFESIVGGGMDMATEEQIQEDYGTINNFDLIDEATAGIGTDEGAIAFAMRNIKSPEELDRFREEFKEVTGKDLLPLLESELSDNEMQQLNDQLSAQFKTHAEEQAKFEDFERRLAAGEIDVVNEGENEENVARAKVNVTQLDRVVTSGEKLTPEQIAEAEAKAEEIVATAKDNITVIREMQQIPPSERVALDENGIAMPSETPMSMELGGTELLMDPTSPMIIEPTGTMQLVPASEAKASPTVIPVVVPAPQKVAPMPDSPIGTSSQGDNARPSYDTSDRFVENRIGT